MERCVYEARRAKVGRQPPAAGGDAAKPPREPAKCACLCRHLDFELFTPLLAFPFKNMHRNAEVNVIITGLSWIHSNLDAENMRYFPSDVTVLSIFKPF